MMDFGYLGSSSNLSALAPPFTLDRTIPQPNSEQFSTFTDPPPAFPFSSLSPTWDYSLSASNPNYYSDSTADFGVKPISKTYLGSESYYPYFGVSSISSPTNHIPPINVNVSTTPDAFVFPQYSAPIPTSYAEPEPYCHTYVSPVTEAKPNYDLSSTSQVDYLQSLSGLKYTPHWGSYWDSIDNLADGEMSKQADYDGNFCSTQIDGSYAYKSYPDQGASMSEGFSICIESPPVTSEVNSKPFPTEGSSFTRYDPARSLGISTFPKSHANAPCVDAAITTILKHQKPYESQDQSFQPLNADTSESVTTKRPSPPVVIRPPPVRFGLGLDKKEPFCDSFASSVRGDLSNKPLSENVEKELTIPSMNAPPYSFTSLSDKAKSVSSVEGPLESLDRYYPALDSPCWKGISSFRSSPSEDHEPSILEHNVMKHQQTQFFTPFGEDNAKISSQKAPENGYVELGSLLCPDNFPNAISPVKVDDSTHYNGADRAKMRSGNLDPFSSNIEKLTKESDSFNDSKIRSALKPLQLKKPDFENDIELGFGVTEAGLGCNSVSSKLDVQMLVETIHNLSKLLIFQCSDDTSALSKVVQESLMLAMKNLDACVSKMVHNPIEESILQKSGIPGRPPLPKEASFGVGFDNHRTEQGRKSSELSEKEVKKFTDLLSARVDEDFGKYNKSGMSSGPPLPKEASSCLGFDFHHPEQGRKNSELSDKEIKKFTNLLSARVDEDFEKDNKVTRGIKKVFEGNFTAREEMQSETLFYKDLWLEAEAALCSVSFKARFDRVKTEMDKYKSPKKLVAEPVKTFEELYGEVFPDPSSPRKGNPIIEAFKKLHNSDKDPSASTTSEAVDEAEASFKARLDILNNRVPIQNYVSTVEATDEEVDAAFAETVKTVEKLLSSEDAEDCSMTNIIPKMPRQHSPSLSTTKSDNFEASVMARLKILNDRGVSGISESFGLQPEPAVRSKYSQHRNPWESTCSTVPIPGEDEITVGTFSRVCKDFHAGSSDDVANQHDMNVKLGCGDGSLSDWEDVLKDEFACQN